MKKLRIKPDNQKIVIDKSSAVSIGLLIPLVSALWWLFDMNGQVNASAQNVTELQRAVLDTNKSIQDINSKLSTIEGYLKGLRESHEKD